MRADTSVILEANEDILLLVGSLARNHQEALLALSVDNGELLWSGSQGYVSTILLSDGRSFAADLLGVSAYESSSGASLWQSSVLNSRSPTSIVLYDALLNVNTARGVFHLIDPLSGRVLRTTTYPLGSDVYVSTDSLDLHQGPDPGDLQLKDLASGAAWRVNVGGAIHDTVTLTQAAVLVRTGRYEGDVVAIDRATGQPLWRAGDGHVVSNIDADARSAYFLTDDGSLHVLDLISGEETLSATFSGPGLVLADAGLNPRGYHLAVDPEGESLYCAFGDSRQMIAISLPR